MEMKNLCYITEGDTGGILEAGYDSRGTQKRQVIVGPGFYCLQNNCMVSIQRISLVQSA